MRLRVGWREVAGSVHLASMPRWRQTQPWRLQGTFQGSQIRPRHNERSFRKGSECLRKEDWDCQGPALSVRCDGDGVAALMCQRTPQTVFLNFRETDKNLSG